MVQVDGDGRATLCNSYSCTEISGHLQEAEGIGGGGEGWGSGDEVIVCQAGAQVGREVDAGQQPPIRDVIYGWRPRLKKKLLTKMN